LYNDAADVKIFYTTDGTEPGPNSIPYTGAITLSGPTTLRAASFVNGKQYGKTTVRSIVLNKAFGKEVTFNSNPDRRAVAGNKSLINNLRGSANFWDGEWVGYYGKEMSVTIDLGSAINVTEVRASFLNNPGDNAFAPEALSYAVSTDGTNYTMLEVPVKVMQAGSETVKTFSKNIGQQPVRYIKITARPQVNAGAKTWLYADEIIIE
jgi:hexosaminidase